MEYLNSRAHEEIQFSVDRKGQRKWRAARLRGGDPYARERVKTWRRWNLLDVRGVVTLYRLRWINSKSRCIRIRCLRARFLLHGDPSCVSRNEILNFSSRSLLRNWFGQASARYWIRYRPCLIFATLLLVNQRLNEAARTNLEDNWFVILLLFNWSIKLEGKNEIL